MKKAVSIIALAMLAAGVVMWQGADVRAQEAGMEPLITSYELMEILVDPNIESLKEAVATEPEKRRGWQAIYKSSLAIGELMTLNNIRNDEDYMSTPEWGEMNLATRGLAVEISEAAKGQDFAGVTAKYQAMIESCNACHTKFEPDTAPTVEP